MNAIRSHYFCSQVSYFLYYHHQLCQLYLLSFTAMLAVPPSHSNNPPEFVHLDTPASHTSCVSKELLLIDQNDPACVESTVCETGRWNNHHSDFVLTQQKSRDETFFQVFHFLKEKKKVSENTTILHHQTLARVHS